MGAIVRCWGIVLVTFILWLPFVYAQSVPNIEIIDTYVIGAPPAYGINVARRYEPCKIYVHIRNHELVGQHFRLSLTVEQSLADLDYYIESTVYIEAGADFWYTFVLIPWKNGTWNYKVLICDPHPPGYLIDEANGTFNVLPGNIDKSFGLLEAGVNSLSSDLKKLETRVDDIESLNLQAQIDQLRNQLQNDYYQLLIAYTLGTVGTVLGLVAMVLALLYRRKMHSFWEKASKSST
jgi:hypothetical protein